MTERARVVNARTAAGWDVYIGRGSDPSSGHRLSAQRWGNPFPIARFGKRGSMLRYFRHLEYTPGLIGRIRTELAGKVLACWCKPAPCHGDVLAAIANGKTLQQVRADWALILGKPGELF